MARAISVDRLAKDKRPTVFFGLIARVIWQRRWVAAASNRKLVLKDPAASACLNLVDNTVRFRLCNHRVKPSDQTGRHGWAVRDRRKVLKEPVLLEGQMGRLGEVQILGRSRAVLWGVSLVRRSW
jgi:hypothetical protein